MSFLFVNIHVTLLSCIAANNVRFYANGSEVQKEKERLTVLRGFLKKLYARRHELSLEGRPPLYYEVCDKIDAVREEFNILEAFLDSAKVAARKARRKFTRNKLFTARSEIPGWIENHRATERVRQSYYESPPAATHNFEPFSPVCPVTPHTVDIRVTMPRNLYNELNSEVLGSPQSTFKGYSLVDVDSSACADAAASARLFNSEFPANKVILMTDLIGSSEPSDAGSDLVIVTPHPNSVIGEYLAQKNPLDLQILRNALQGDSFIASPQIDINAAYTSLVEYTSNIDNEGLLDLRLYSEPDVLYQLLLEICVITHGRLTYTDIAGLLSMVVEFQNQSLIYCNTYKKLIAINNYIPKEGELVTNAEALYNDMVSHYDMALILKQSIVGFLSLFS